MVIIVRFHYDTIASHFHHIMVSNATVYMNFVTISLKCNDIYPVYFINDHLQGIFLFKTT